MAESGADSNTWKNSSYKVHQGSLGEDIAVAWLESRGWNILQRNFRKRAGEVDIVARDGVYLSFVEVKHWKKAALDDISMVLGEKKKARMHQLSKYWVQENRGLLWTGMQYRFDLVTIEEETGRLELYEGALDF